MSRSYKRSSEFTRRNSKAGPIREALNQMLSEYRLTGKFNEARLIESWGRLMGKPIATRTSRIYIKDKVLNVYLTSAPLKSELLKSKSKILAMLEKESGKGIIEDIRFY